MISAALASRSRREPLEHPLQVFERTKSSVAAYPQVLEECGFKDFVPSSLKDWQRIPWIDKETYINRFPPEALSSGGRIAALAHASSGSSGKPTFWFRGNKQKRIGAAYYARVIDEVMRIPRSERVLVIVCFAMGVWVAGTYTLLAFERIGEQAERNLAVISPGMEIEDISSILSGLGRRFDHVVIAGYPTALDVSFSELAHRNVSLPEKLYLITSGDKISEEWRDARMSSLGIPAPTSIVNVYGSADGGLLAIETPLSIEIRRKLSTFASLAAEIQGEAVGPAAALFQFDPTLFYFEDVDGELLFTADLDIPLVRYNIHDRGRVVPYEEMMSLVGELGIQNANGWEFPFLVVSGRTDVAVTLYGAKVYPETLQRAIQDVRIRDLLSGTFLAYSLEKESEQLFCLDLELSDSTCLKDSESPAEIESIIQEGLMEFSSEYRNSCQKLGNVMNRPHVQLYEKGDTRFPELCKDSGCKNEHSAKAGSAFFWPVGRKPKMVALNWHLE
jgi:phenylacetate-CoA ligase